MKKFTKIGLIAGAALCALSCGPQFYSLDVDMRRPSLSGLDLRGKNISVAYLENGFGRDSAFVGQMADGFATSLEKDYFGGEQAINIYRMRKDNGVNYASKDTLINLLMDSGDDVVFLFDTPDFGNVNLSESKPVGTAGGDTSTAMASFPVTLYLYAYDSMSKVDTLRIYKGATSVGQPLVFPSGESRENIVEGMWANLGSVGWNVGDKSATKFVSTWKEEQLIIAYYDTPATWSDAVQAAYEYKWHDAIDKWLSLLNTKNLYKRSMAEYNIATALYMLEDYDLATEWLDRADTDNPGHPLTKNLRKKIRECKSIQ